jgi:hypothetical protein
MNVAPLAALLVGGAAVATSVLVGLSSSPTQAADPAKAPGPALGGGSAAMRSGPDTNPGHPIRLSGVVTGRITPGRPATLTVTVSNPNNQDVVVTSLTGSVTSVSSQVLAGRPPCSATWFTVGTFAGARTIAAKGSAEVAVPVALTDLPATNQDNCKGGTLQLAFTAQARQA